jgi:SCP-2 sterol transfer family protein
MVHTDFFWFLSNSIHLLEKESRENFLRLNARLGGLRAKISDGSQTQIVYFDDRRLVVVPFSIHTDIIVTLDAFKILQLLDGKESLQEAVLNKSIFIQGSLKILETYNEALGIYLHGALRSPGFPAILSRFRRSLTGGA